MTPKARTNMKHTIDNDYGSWKVTTTTLESKTRWKSKAWLNKHTCRRDEVVYAHFFVVNLVVNLVVLRTRLFFLVVARTLVLTQVVGARK